LDFLRWLASVIHVIRCPTVSPRAPGQAMLTGLSTVGHGLQGARPRALAGT
jgi:hypothetical protein